MYHSLWLLLVKGRGFPYDKFRGEYDMLSKFFFVGNPFQQLFCRDFSCVKFGLRNRGKRWDRMGCKGNIVKSNERDIFGDTQSKVAEAPHSTEGDQVVDCKRKWYIRFYARCYRFLSGSLGKTRGCIRCDHTDGARTLQLQAAS